MYKSIVLPVVFCGCEEEHRLRLFEKSAFKKTFGLRADELLGGWRKLHNEELHNLDSSQNIITMIKSRRMRWTGHVARMGEGEGI
jgi:hypothetical protein